MQFELVGVDRAVDASGQAQAIGGMARHARLEEDDGSVLGARDVCGETGVADGLRGVVVARRHVGHADPRFQTVQRVLAGNRPRQFLQQAFQCLVPRLQRAHRQRELVATHVPGRAEALAQSRHARGHRAQRVVAGLAPQAVLDQLHAAQLDARDAAGPGHRADAVRQRVGVGQAAGHVVRGAVGQLALLRHAIGHVLGEHQARGPAAQLDVGGVHAHFQQPPVLALVHPHAHIFVLLAHVMGEVVDDLLPVFDRADVEDRHGEEFLARVTVLRDRRFVDLDEAQRLHVEHPERQRVALEEQAELTFGFGQRLLRLHARRDVDHRAGHLLRAVRAGDGGTARGNPACATVSAEDAVVDRVRLSCVPGLREMRRDAFAVVRMHDRVEVFGARRLPRAVEPQQGRDLLRPADHAFAVGGPGAGAAEFLRASQAFGGFGQAPHQLGVGASVAPHHAHQVGQADEVQHVQRDARDDQPPPGREHDRARRADVHVQRIVGHGAGGGDARHAVLRVVVIAQQARLDAGRHDVVVEAAHEPGAAAVGEDARLRVGELDKPGAVAFKLPEQLLQFTRVQAGDDPAVVAHAHGQRQQPLTGTALQRADVHRLRT